MTISEGDRLCSAAFNAGFTAEGFNWAKALPNLEAAAAERARAKAGAGGLLYDFKECGIVFGPGHQEVDVWSLSLLLAEHAAGLLAQKAAEGRCPAHGTCRTASGKHLGMLEDLKADLLQLAARIGEVMEAIKGLPALGEEAAQGLGLRP